MNPSINISAKNLIGSLCVSADDGQKLHDDIAKYIRNERKIIVSFKGVDTLISAFLNAAIGQLYGEFPESLIQERLTVEGMEPEDFELLTRVVNNAKVYFENRRSFDTAWKTEADDK